MSHWAFAERAGIGLANEILAINFGEDKRE